MLFALFKSLGFALKGTYEAFSTQRNFRIHIFSVLIVVSLGLYYEIKSSEWIAIVLCIGLVLITEMLNTAVEYLVNLVEPNSSTLAGKIKDISAGAVFISAIIAVAVAIIIFGKKFLSEFSDSPVTAFLYP